MKETEFRDFVEVVGQWFDGFSKFARIVNRHNDTFYVGEAHMIEKLAAASQNIDRHLKEYRKLHPDEEVNPAGTDAPIDTGVASEHR